MPFAVHGAVSGALTRPEEATVVTPEAIPKVNQAAPLGEETTTAPPPTTGPAGGAVHGATAETMASGGEEPAARPATPQEANVPPTTPTPPTPVDQLGQVQPIPEEVSPHEPAQPQSLAEMQQPGQQPAAEDIVRNAGSARVRKGFETKSAQPELPESAPESEQLQYTQSQNVPAGLSSLVKSDSLADAAKAASAKIDNPIARDIAQHVAALVPPDAKIGVADFSQPVSVGGREYSGQVSAGLYHPDSQTALISDQTNNPVASIIHEATHAALNNAITNPDILSPEAKVGISQVQYAYRKALASAPTGGRPVWMKYGLSSPEEFVSASVSDPRFQRWLSSVSSAPERPNVVQSVFQGAARVLGVKRDIPGNLYERTLSGITAVDAVPHETRSQGPIYAANPFGNIKGRAWPHWMTTSERKFRQGTMTMRANLDATPETRPLSRAMDQAFNIKDQLFGERAQAGVDLKRLGKGRMKEIAAEFSRMAEQVDKGQAPTTSDPVVRQIWQTLSKFKAQDAQFMRDNGFHVQLPDGSWREFYGVDPDKFIPRQMRADVSAALRSPRDSNGNYTKEFIELFNEGLQKGFFTKPEDLEKYVPQVGQGLTQGPRTTAMETARTMKLPNFFYDYSIDAQLRNLYQATDTRARLASFGQSRPGVPDMFQKTIENINANQNMPFDQKQIAVQNVQFARDEWYHQNNKGLYNQMGAGLRSGVSAIQTGNYYTSLKVGLARLFFSMQNKGVFNTGRALIDTMTHFAASRDTARGLGIIKDAVTWQQEDLWNPDKAYDRYNAIVRHIIEASGHGEFNRIANTIDMKASQLWLASNLREIARNPTSVASRMAREIIERRGVDLGKLQAGDFQETRNFLRQWVNDTQTSYRIMDMPVWSKTQFGKMVLQYQPWAYNATRMLFKETIMPGMAAMGRGDINLGARYLGRLVYFGAMAAGTEELMKSLREWVFGRETTAPSWSEFFGALNNHNNGLALKLFGGRLVDELVSGTFLGMGGDYARSIMNYATGHNEVAHAWNPENPPALSVVQSFWDLFNKFNIQGGRLSDKDVSNFVGNMFSMWREGKNLGYSANIALKQTTGAALPLPGFSEARGLREKEFAQARYRQFTNDFPEFRSSGGNYPPTPSGYYYSQLQDALYAGDVQRAKGLVAQMSKDPKIHSEHLGRGLISSMSHHQPIPGGIDGEAFLHWAQQVLPPAELQRIQDVQNAFVKNAMEAGIFKANAVKTHQVGYAKKGVPARVLLINP